MQTFPSLQSFLAKAVVAFATCACISMWLSVPLVQVVELGSIGRCRQGSSSNTCTLYAHRQQPPDFGNATTLLQTMQQGAADVPGAQVGGGTHVLAVAKALQMSTDQHMYTLDCLARPAAI